MTDGIAPFTMENGAQKLFNKTGLTELTASLKAWIEKTLVETKLSDYGSLPYLTFLTLILFVHYLCFVLANNSGVQKSKGSSQALFEVQIYLQTVVVKLLLYYGSFLFGLFLGAGNNSTGVDLQLSSPFIAFFVLVFIINKVCVVFTGQKNAEYTLGPAGAATGIFSLNQNKWIYVPVTWLQTVTDIIIQQTVPGSLLGYAVGKVVASLKGTF